MAESHDDILRKHREKFEAHRQWMSQQQAELRDLTVGSTPRESPAGSQQASSRAPADSPMVQQPPQQQQVAISPAPGQSWAQSRRFHEDPSYPSQQGGGAGGYPQYQSQGRSASARHHQQQHPTGSPLSVHSRSTQWNKRRNQRLEEMRRQRKDETNDECTFTPMVSHRSTSIANSEMGSGVVGTGGAGRSGSNIMDDQSPIYVKGYDEFLARQEHSRKLSDQKKKRLKSDGSGWRNELTVVEEFQLGNRRPTQLASLQRPIRAPLRHGVNDNHEFVSNEASPPRQRGGEGGEGGDGNPFEAAGMPPQGTFSERSSSAIIDVAVLKQQEKPQY